jgi:hypothetical protein
VSFLLVYEDKDNHSLFFLCVQNGWAGGHWSSLRKFYGRNHDLVAIDRYAISVLQMIMDVYEPTVHLCYEI